MRAPLPASPLIWLGRRWVRQQIRRYSPAGEPLEAADRRALAPWFEAPTLDGLRLCQVAAVAGPGPLRPLAWLGFRPLFDFGSAAAITFGDLVLISAAGRCRGGDWRRLLFHELVHVVQYRLLGVDGFVEHYVRGWLDHGRDYYRIPLERQAYDLEAEYREPLSAAVRCFSVEAEVARALGRGEEAR